jgi:hypothetical protein
VAAVFSAVGVTSEIARSGKAETQVGYVPYYRLYSSYY